MKTRTLALTPLFVVGLAWGQTASRANVASPVSTATLRTLAKGNGNDQDAAEALGYGASTSKALRLAAQSVKDREELLARAQRQLAPSTAKGFGASSRIVVKGKPANRIPLAGGLVLYDFTLSSAVLIPAKIQAETSEDEAMKAIADVVFKHVRIPANAQSPVTGQLIQERTSTGDTLWRGSLSFGHTPDANGVYKISNPKWYDSASVWADGQYVWVRFGRDDTIMGAASGNPNGITRKGGLG